MEEKNEKNECFICFEVSNQKENSPSRLNNQIEFFKICSCDGWVHNKCIEKWCNIYNTCPICHEKMKYTDIDFLYGLYIIHYFILTKKIVYRFIPNIPKLINALTLCVIITNIMNIVSVALHKFEKTNYEYTYNNYTAPQIL